MNLNQLTEEIAFLLKKRNWNLVTAESCTGGLIASQLTSLAGSSSWFERGFVTYSNAAKQDLLAVPSKLIELHGAVSEEVALAMAEGALVHSKSQIAVSVTGIAGPDGGSAMKPVGTVFLACSVLNEASSCIKKQFVGNRSEIRLAACNEALNQVLASLKKI